MILLVREYSDDPVRASLFGVRTNECLVNVIYPRSASRPVVRVYFYYPRKSHGRLIVLSFPRSISSSLFLSFGFWQEFGDGFGASKRADD